MTSVRFTAKLALVTLACYAAYHRWTPADDALIEVSPSVVDAVIERQEALLARPLRDDERAAAKAGYIEEEILVREAYRRGLDQRARPLVIERAYRELLRRASYERPTPTDAELRAFYDAHAERYRVPERVDLEVVMLPAGTAAASLEGVLAELRGGADHRAAVSGGRAGADVSEVTVARLAGAFGVELATEIVSLPVGEWHGPFIAATGPHLVRVVARYPSREPSYEEVRSYVEEDFLRHASDRVVDAELDRIRRRYRVEIEGGH